MNAYVSISTDQSVSAMAERRQVLQQEASRIDAFLSVYEKQCTGVQDRRQAVAPLMHYSMTELTPCGCDFCNDWEMRRTELNDAMKFIPVGHKWSTCGCPTCRFVGRLQMNFAAASNKRDVVIEMSYHAKYHSVHGDAVMSWLMQDLSSARCTVNWCAQEMARFPVAWWIRRCELALSTFVSGVVFKSIGLPFFTPGASSLLAETGFVR